MLTHQMFCNYYPLDSIACVSQTIGIKCYYNQFESSCMDTSSTSHGCQPTLNQLACLNQLTNSIGEEARCTFGKRCVSIKPTHLIRLGCDERFSKYACTNVARRDCIWNGNKCTEYVSIVPEGEQCESIFGNSVTPSLCSKIQNLKCMNGGFSQDYKCISVNEQVLGKLKCTDLGINQATCISISTSNQQCIFIQNKCQDIKSVNINKCEMELNRLGCLGIYNPKLLCQWKSGKCQNFVKTLDSKCENVREVNQSVCQQFEGKCKFDTQNFLCKIPTIADKLTCNTNGLTKELCLSLKNQYCTFTNGKCEEITLEDLKYYQCEMLLNQDACVNVQTQYQYCKWDGLSCIRQIINQDLDCELDKNDTISKYNGNVCQAISKPNVSCKYNAQTHRCMNSDANDLCDSSYINLFGCVSITKPGQTCQWTLNGCIQIEIKALETTCFSLQFANPNACSQVYENSQKGCYFNEDTSKCESIDIVNSSSLLNTLECQNRKKGLNRVACASITTQGQICRWNQNQCQQIRKKVDVAQVECLKMQFVNPQACALVEYGKEPCRYLEIEKSCVNSIISTMTCNTAGLNTYSCAQVVGSCYFDTELNRCKQLDSTNPDTATQVTELLQNMQCQSSSPTMDVCTKIITFGQLCSWSDRQSRCLNQTVLLNQKCSNFSSGVKVNANVCAAIEMEFPDYDFRIGINSDVDRGYCKFMAESGTCSKNTDLCSTPCCTEKIGINAHSCSRFSSQTPGVYCFFGSNLRCQQLTWEVVDISKPDAVKNYYNANQMRCSQMNRNSCHMIEWSSKQLCYHNGKSCVNLNYSNYGNLDIFIQFPAILNRYGCLAIEATITNRNTLKYFLYDDFNKRCKPNVVTNYPTCDEVKGNSNVCLRFTQNILCKWNPILLRCQDITLDEYEEIYTCSYNQNYKACIENPNTACQFSLINDKCIDAPIDVECDYFNSNGPVSQSACVRITKDGQLCEYDSGNKACNGCDVTGANSITCYKNTGGYCRWDPKAYVCYENQTEISQLGCEDYLNKNLCVQVTKEPCVWDNSKFKCIKLTLTDKQFVLSDNLYNRLGCYSITGGPYYHHPDYRCLSLTDRNYKCKDLHMNEYACLFHTLNNDCYFDRNESPLNYKCKPFTGEQTKCSTNVAINIEVCMQIPSSCYFNQNTLKCVDVEITETQTCTNLKLQQISGYFYNRIACASISQYLDTTNGFRVCYGITNNAQQCHFEKYCYWHSVTKTCEIWQPTIEFKFHPSYNYVCDHDEDGNEIQCEKEAVCEDQSLTNSLTSCSNLYSRALCLEMVVQQCYFDINQGGCLPLSNNQHKLPDCTSLVKTCDVSQTPGIICELSSADPDLQPGKQCKSISRGITKCINNGSVQLGLECALYSNESSPVICASASDACRLNNKCVSTEPSLSQGETKIDKCDKSMSQTMCEDMGCNYTKLNYCQKTASVPQKTSTNQYYLCYEVNQLKIANKDEICSQVDQSCIYSSKCEDATGYTCSQLISNKVSKKACISCLESKVVYNADTYRCSVISNETFTTCDDNLNQSACLINTPNILCKWDSNQCTLISNLSNETSTDCTIYNQYACPQLTKANCYVNISTSLCSNFDPINAKCSDIKQKSLCIQSNYERCKWDDVNKCVKVETETDYTCSIANQYGCLNMTSKQCGWSSTNKACYSFNFDPDYNRCNNFVLINSSSDSDNPDPDRNLDKFNSLVCSNLGISRACIRDEQYRCREVISADQLKCDSPGINEYACVNKTVGKCKYDVISKSCVEDLGNTNGCSNKLNIEACLIQNDVCKFINNTCQQYDLTGYTNIDEDDKFPYSIKVCSYFDDVTTASIVYSPEKMRCVKATTREPFINNCSQVGINKYACLNKTTVQCQYDNVNKQCLSVTREKLTSTTTCDPTFSWIACISINAQCQFKDNQCQSVPITTLCQDLNNSSVPTNSMVCQTRENPTDKACKWNTETKACNVVSGTTEVCSQPGLNKIGCIFNTLGSLCIYLNGFCTDNYENVKCTDLINKDKCLSIRTKGQFCKFDSTLGCIDISSPQTALISCLNSLKTNPLSCSQSTDIPCFYDNTNNVCKEFRYPIQSEDAMFYNWSNRISFNQKACLMYIENNLAVYWMDECLEIPASEFSSLTCDKPVNKWGCLRITNPLSNCQFNSVTSTCQEADLSTYVNIDCNTIVNVNNARFCEVNNKDDVKCQYDSANRECSVLLSPPITECENKGYNLQSCLTNTDKCQFNKKCYSILESGKLFCSDASSNLEECKNVQSEGCNQSCQPITDYSIVNCENVINQYGCTRIIKSQQYCLYTNQQCSFINPKTFQSTTCKNISNINNPLFCEQPADVGCYYDQDSYSCKTTTTRSLFGCVRGINQIACLTSTIPSLQCKFLDYCYGPNSAFLNCNVEDNIDPNACCQNAKTIESCLFQDKLKCSWNPDTPACVPYVAENKECGMISNQSKLVCLSKVDTFCVFNTELKKCEQVQPVSCNQAQSYQQCQSIDILPCIWDNLLQICKYKVKQNQDECEDIKQGYGNKLSCLAVERLGQTCQFINGQCETYNESKTENNCLNNINKVACTQQQSSKCYWKYSIIKIKKTSWSQETDLQIGECDLFTDFNNSSCEEYLSYLSCLSVQTTGKQCKWQSGKCQQIEFNKSSIFSPKDLILVNSNACSLINNGDIVQYNPKSYTCKLVIDQEQITCQPLTEGINKQACLKIKSQSCLWDDVSFKCIYKRNRLLVEEQQQQNRLLQSVFTCKRDGIGPKLCKQLNFELPCGSVDDGCDLININTAKCEDPGLNKYACLNLTTGPCAWIKDDDSDYYHCEEYYPYTTCENIEYNINSIVCSYVEDDPCVYNSLKKNCQIPLVEYNVCEIQGINAIACSSIEGCIFKDQKCITWDPNYNLICNQAEKANKSVCQLAIDRCKYSDLTYGCIASTITDNCYTNGLSALGCNVLDECSWNNNSCQCISFLNKFPDCSTITEYTKCTNIDYCYFEVSQSKSSKDITQYLKNTNYGTCRLKTCADVEVNKCNQTTIDHTVCYLNSKAKCLPAHKCEDISDSSLICLQYKVNNQTCRSKSDNSCQTLDCNQILEKSECELYSNECVYAGYCRKRSCEYMGKSQCLLNDYYQCAWFLTTSGQYSCTSTGCRYLGLQQGDCMGTHIGTDVCVQMIDFSCVSCQEIKDACICLNQSQYCTYDKISQKCLSKSCQHHNQEDCPNTHCKFNSNTKICQPLCQYNYNQQQCNQDDQCLWNNTNKICVAYIKPVVIEQINLPSPDYNRILDIIILILIMIY
ncbi:unnamed protein product [Paramecium pentaurelia]|uniref:PSI domain-containing protein n=1 Tax=Paramecium pentaurelia TaxID=43138 RepID=A0A8S1T5E5_9CILI|nr:unnamed protein product [Paramecium pentaurelia]